MRFGGNWEYKFDAATFRPYDNNVNDLGTATARWKDIYAGT